MSSATELLGEAVLIVKGSRNQTHGEKERSFQVIAGLWNIYLDSRRHHEQLVTAVDVAQMMVLLKVARSIEGEPVKDHFIDEAGYAAIAGELASKG